MADFCAVRAKREVSDHRVPLRLGQCGGVIAAVPDKSALPDDFISCADFAMKIRNCDFGLSLGGRGDGLFLTNGIRRKILRGIANAVYGYYGGTDIVAEFTVNPAGNAQDAGEV